jgi:hypothetical protein
VRRTNVRVLGSTKNKGDKIPQAGEVSGHHSHLDPPTSAKSRSRTSEREREKSKGETKGKKILEYDVRSTMTSIVSVKGFFRNWADQNDAQRSGDGGKRNDITIILHFQRRRRIVIVDSGPIVQKPAILAYRSKGQLAPINKYSNAGRRKKKLKIANIILLIEETPRT